MTDEQIDALYERCKVSFDPAVNRRCFARAVLAGVEELTRTLLTEQARFWKGY